MSLKISNVKKSFGTGESKISILKGLNLDVSKGKIVAILGQSGSGKSTLLSLLAGLDTPDEGSIEISGRNILSLPRSEMNRWRGEKIGIVFQQFHLMPHLTALENVELPLDIHGRPSAPAKQLLEEMGLGSRAHHTPQKLSGGECQRVAIARALSMEPDLLLADEPSGNLDQETGEKVMEAFFRQARKHQTTTILVTHNKDLALRCDQRFTLSRGQLVEINA